MRQGLFVGLTTLDVIHTVRDPIAGNLKLAAVRSELAAGGPAAVAAVAFATLGGAATLVTAIGQGPAATLVRQDLLDAGVEVIDLAPAGYEIAPSTAIVTSATGERLVVSGSTHAPEIRPVGSEFDGLALGADVLLIDGHLPTLARAAVRAADRRGIPIVVDAGSHKPVFDDVLGSATDIICSADYRHPAGLEPSQLQQGERTALVAVSRGAEPLTWFMRGATGVVPVPQVEAVDTLGAGDVLHGSYAWCLAEGMGRLDALRASTKLASQRVSIEGQRAWRGRLTP